MDLSHRQKLLVDMPAQCDGLFNNIVFIADRKTGKSVMQIEIIMGEIEKLMSGEIARRNGKPLWISHLSNSSQTAESFREKLFHKIEEAFDTKPARDYSIEVSNGLDSSRETFPIMVCATGLNPAHLVGTEHSAIVIDEFSGNLKNLPISFLYCQRIVFRSQPEETDNLGETIVVDVRGNEMF